MIVSHRDPAPGEKRHPFQVHVRVCDDHGRADSWSVLVTWLEVLSGMPPFWWLDKQDDRKVYWRGSNFFSNCYNRPKVMTKALDSRYKDLLSAEALGFFKHALVVDWHARPTPAQLLDHPYVCG